MKKLTSGLIALLMFASILQVGFYSVPAKAAESQNAVFIASRFIPVGFERDGTALDPGIDFPWQKPGEMCWGGDEYGMPDTELAVLAHYIYSEEPLGLTPEPVSESYKKGPNEYAFGDINIPARPDQPHFDELGNQLYDQEGFPITTNTTVQPLLWTEFYLMVDPASGKSQEYNRWYAVYDSAGQLWFDKDGYFNDCRYYEFADPSNLYDTYEVQFDPEKNDLEKFLSAFQENNTCRNNKNAIVDPIGSNNTQGPYFLDPDHPMYRGDMDAGGITRNYFWDREGTGRYFRIGWIDMPDFPILIDEFGVRSPTSVVGNLSTHGETKKADWDGAAQYPLYDFSYWGLPSDFADSMGLPRSVSCEGVEQVDSNAQPYDDYTWYYTSDPNDDESMYVNVYDELHADNINASGNRIKPDPVDDGIDYYANVSAYHPGEWIYRKGVDTSTLPPTPNNDYTVQVGDFRLTPVAVRMDDGKTYYKYAANTTVKEGDKDVDISLWRFVANFAETGMFAGERTGKANDEMHTENINSSRSTTWGMDFDWTLYEYGEWIYKEAGTTGFGVVSYGDFRLSNVNNLINPITNAKYLKRGYVNATMIPVPAYPGSLTKVPRIYGDVLLLGEVLHGGCNEPTYNLSVQTDVWSGIMPSVTSAALRSPNKDIQGAVQSVQKNTVLDPTGEEFFVPATTFQNINLKYREYIGVEIFKDNGVSNDICDLDETLTRAERYNLFPYNLSDDQEEGIACEEYLGAEDSIITSRDIGRVLTPFPSDVMYYEGSQNPIYGCQEPIYKNKNKVDDGLGNQIVNEGDIRLTDRMITRSNLVTEYKAGSEVSEGDLDVGDILFHFSKLDMFYDQDWPNEKIFKNGTYDIGEDIYHLGNMEIDQKQFLPVNHQFYMGLTTGSGTERYFDTVLYYDADGDGKASPGDIRVFDLSGRFPNGSILTVHDADCPTSLSSWDNYDTLLYYPMDGLVDIFTLAEDYDVSRPGATIPDYKSLYVDMDNSYDPLDPTPEKTWLTPNDVRLTWSYIYAPFTVVQPEDFDYEHYIIPESPLGLGACDANLRLWDRVDHNVLISDPENDDEILYDAVWGIGVLSAPDPSVYLDDIIVMIKTKKDNTRMTDIQIEDNTYLCGSLIGEKIHYWWNQNIVHGFTVGKNGDSRFIDWEVFPSDKLGMEVHVTEELKVEQTSTLKITVEPPPRPGYWDDNVYIPQEEVYVFVKDVVTGRNIFIDEDYRVLDGDHQMTSFEITPYRGSCSVDGNYKGFKRLYEEGRYVLEDFDNRLRIVAIRNTGGIDDSVPPEVSLYDPFWKQHDNRSYFNGQNELGRLIGHAYGCKPQSTPPWNDNIPPLFHTSYDCFTDMAYVVGSEDMRFTANKKCVGVLDQKFPNLFINLIDKDNKNDVNDPADLPISTIAGREVVAFYNANGAGIDYMFTGYMVEPLDSSIARVYNNDDMGVNDPYYDDLAYSEKVIVQVNEDGTFCYWHWDDVGPHKGILDPGDDLWVPNPNYIGPLPVGGDKYDIAYMERIPGYIQTVNSPQVFDSDCSEGKYQCHNCGGSDFRNDGLVSYGDKYGPFKVATFGVPVYLRNHGDTNYSSSDSGGVIPVTVIPRSAATKLQVQVKTFNLIFDYNSEIQHPPYFIEDGIVCPPGMFHDEVFFDIIGNPGGGLRRYESMGVDYCGVKSFKVLAPDPYVNFAEMAMVDHALQNSEVNYTSGTMDNQPISNLPLPTPQIQSPYNPIVQDVGRDCKGYPGGQTHTGRLRGGVISSGYTRTTEDHSGWNAYPAIWWWKWYDDVDINNFTDFNKLGTEFFPLTDYGIYFIVKDINGNHLSFDEKTDQDFRIRRMEITGPFAQPKIFNQVKHTVTPEYEYNNVRNVPINYDWSGKIVVEHSNMQDYEYDYGYDWTDKNGDWDISQPDNELTKYPNENAQLRDGGQLDFRGLTNVFRFEEIIPISHGIINIKVILWDGTVKIYQDCCAEPPTDGIDAHALEIVTESDHVVADVDNKVVATIKEYEMMQSTEMCNDAFVFVWQDRGVATKNSKLFNGAGDGWVTNPPRNTVTTELKEQYDWEEDLNNDGKISFRDYETEIIGTYDMATNTWAGGLIDARTFQRNNGLYEFDLSASNGALVNTIGIDFGGPNDEPDHVISENETLPIMITAYKYGDDDNDRAFTPLYGLPGTPPQYSHEVYLSGQKFLTIEPVFDLSVSVQPNPLTAGVTPELVDPVSPLSFVLTDQEGNPVDLSVGVLDMKGNREVLDDHIWNFLFKDIHPDPLPEYYWLRTDLHNDDETRISNRYLYSTSSAAFQPIKIDFSLAKDGKYAFRGFCANDEGEFDVIIYTPDRKHAAKAQVNVVLPTVEYSIANAEDPGLTTYMVPGEPDFVLTAADNRIYRITITAKNAQGLLLKGVSKGVSTCGGGIKNTARFTPYMTRPASFDFDEKDRKLFAEHFLQDLYPYIPHLGFDFNDNAKIDRTASELCQAGGFVHTKNRNDQVTLGHVYYNTTLVRFDEQSIYGGWDIEPNRGLVPPVKGWGLGAIYNSAHKGGYLFADIDPNEKLDYHDSLGLDVNAQTTFYVFAEDICYIGGLVGDNVYCNNPSQADLCGYPPKYKTDPAHTISRFDPGRTNDNTFFLDWEAFPSHEVHIAPPRLTVLSALTRVELGQDLLNAANYDLTYAIENNMIVQVRPADSRDLPMHEDGRVFLFGNQHQTAIYGDTTASPTDPSVMETTLFFTPTGVGEQIASLGYFNPNHHYHVEPYQFDNTSTYTLRDLLHFDSIVGLQVEVASVPSLNPNVTSELTISVSEIGTNAPVEGAKVTIEGPGINTTGTTNEQGVLNTKVTPNKKGIVTIHVTNTNMMEGHTEVWVKPDTTEPILELDPVASITNKATLEVTGMTNPGNEVTVNNEPATVSQNGTFSIRVTLEEGLNTIIATATTPTGKTVRRMLTITLDTTPPMIFVDDPGALQGSEPFTYTLTGRVEPDCKVTVNNQDATVTHDIWSIDVTIKPGKNAFVITATDVAGNVNTMNFEVIVEE
ncbi:MAG TPA: hypothetical protein PLV00_00655 [Caldisericia bacterium]|nr:hypothetical protein [Caldisericia bacterium]